MAVLTDCLWELLKSCSLVKRRYGFMKIGCNDVTCRTLVFLSIFFLLPVAFAIGPQAALSDITASSNTTSALLEQIITGYDKRIIPKPASGGPVVVTVDIYVRSISSVDEISMRYDTDLVVRQVWTDSRLSFTLPPGVPEDSYVVGGIFMADRIWASDLFFSNSKKAYTHDITQENVLLWMWHNGTVMYNVRVSSTFMCQMDLVDYPFDTQKCVMQLGSFGHTEDDIVFVWKADYTISMNDNITLPQFGKPRPRTVLCENRHYTGNFSCLKVEFTFRRRLGYHLSQSFIPCALLVCCSWLSFWLHPDATPARAGLGVTTFLAIYTQASGVRYSLPPVSYTKAIDIWFNVCTVFIFLSLVEFAIVNYTLRHTKAKNYKVKDGKAREVDIALNQINGSPDKNTDSPSDLDTITSLRRTFEHTVSTVVPPGKRKAKTLDLVSRVAFPLTFILFLLIYFVHYYARYSFFDIN